MHVFGLFECHVIEIAGVFFKAIIIMSQIGEGNESYYYMDYYKWISAYKRAHLNKITNKIS